MAKTGKTNRTISDAQWKNLRDQGMTGQEIHAAVANGSLTGQNANSYKYTPGGNPNSTSNTMPDANPFSVKPSSKPEVALNNLFSGGYLNSGAGPTGSFVRNMPSIPSNFSDMRNRYETETGATAPAQVFEPAFTAPGLKNTEDTMHNNWLNSDASAYEYLRQSMNGMTPFERDSTISAVQSTEPFDYITGKTVDVADKYNKYVGNQEAIKDRLNQKTEEEEVAGLEQENQKIIDRYRAGFGSTAIKEGYKKDTFGYNARIAELEKEELAKKGEFSQALNNADSFSAYHVGKENDAKKAEQNEFDQLASMAEQTFTMNPTYIDYVINEYLTSKYPTADNAQLSEMHNNIVQLGFNDPDFLRYLRNAKVSGG